MLHNALFVKLLRRNVPVCFVLLLINWYSQLQCCVRWQNKLGDSFSVLCGVRQGGVLSPYLFAVYVDDLISLLRRSGYGLYIGRLFIGCLLYADDIVLLSPSCFGLRKLANICEDFGNQWDIKFNPLKSQLMTFGGNNPSSMTLSMNGVPLPWVSKVKYLGVSFLCNTGKTDMSDTIRKFYSQFNNIMSVLGKGSQEMNAVHLMKTYCLPTLTYGIENSSFCDNTRHKIQVIWNNCFRHIFSCCWRESVKPLQYFCNTLPLSYAIDQSKLLFWKKMFVSDNQTLRCISSLIRNHFIAVGSVYGVCSPLQSVGSIKESIWLTFAQTVRF